MQSLEVDRILEAPGACAYVPDAGNRGHPGPGQARRHDESVPATGSRF
jgi:hypothetical protein